MTFPRRIGSKDSTEPVTAARWTTVSTPSKAGAIASRSAMSAWWHVTPGTARRLSARRSYVPSSWRRSAPPMSPLIPVTSTVRGAIARAGQTIETWTRLLTRSSRAECHGSGTRLLVRYANDTPESGSAQQYEVPTPPWPNVPGNASEPSPRIVSVVPRKCGPSPRCIAIPMAPSTRSPVKLRVTYASVRAGRPLERERADRASQQLVILPDFPWHLRVGKAALMREELDDGDVALAVGLEPGQMIGDPIGERERAAVDQGPHGARGEDLGVRVEQPQRLVARGHALGLEPRVAERPRESELAVTRDGDLRGGIASLRDVRRDQLAQAAERLGIEAETFDAGRFEWECHGRNSSTRRRGPRSARGVDDGLRVFAEPHRRARLERDARSRIEARGIEAVPIVKLNDRAELRGVHPLDPRGRRLPRAPAASFALEAPLDQIELGVLAGPSDRSARGRRHRGAVAHPTSGVEPPDQEQHERHQEPGRVATDHIVAAPAPAGEEEDHPRPQIA